MRVKLLVDWKTGGWLVTDLQGLNPERPSVVVLEDPTFHVDPERLRYHLAGSRQGHAWVEGVLSERNRYPGIGKRIEYRPKRDHREGRTPTFRWASNGEPCGKGVRVVYGTQEGLLYGYVEEEG